MASDIRMLRALNPIFFGALIVSVIHYTDTWVRFDRYAVNPEGLVTEPLTIPAAWLVLTAAGVLGYLQARRHRWWPAVALLAIYSLSGFVGFGHYAEAPLSAYDPVQHVVIVAGLVAGFAVLGFAGWLMFRRALPSLEQDLAAPKPGVIER